MNPRLNRLKSDHEKICELESRSPFVKVIKAVGNPPTEYTFRLSCKGITNLASGRPVFSEQHDVRITLPPNYPRVQPVLEMLTPIFHPNFNGSTICIGHSYSPSMGLDDLVIVIIQMIRYETLNPASAYNQEAVTWAKRNHIPIDKRQILREEDIQINILDEINIVDNSDDLLGQINIF